MQTLTIRHRTQYRYRNPVEFGEHRLMFRPRDSHDLRLVDAQLRVRPTANVRWMHDVFGNSITVLQFKDRADELYLESEITVEHFSLDSIVFPVADFAETVPFSYDAAEIADLGRTAERHYPDPSHLLDSWVRSLMPKNGPPRTQEVLLTITQAINRNFSYNTRLREGTQVPGETLRSKSGTCRDFALLMMEAARSLGMAARFVTGYLYDSSLESGAGRMRGSGATHAWVQIYLPGAGWVEYDPTNGLVGSRNLVRVAVARDPSQAIPVQGSFTGGQEDFEAMEIDVKVTAKS